MTAWRLWRPASSTVPGGRPRVPEARWVVSVPIRPDRRRTTIATHGRVVADRRLLPVDRQTPGQPVAVQRTVEPAEFGHASARCVPVCAPPAGVTGPRTPRARGARGAGSSPAPSVPRVPRRPGAAA